MAETSIQPHAEDITELAQQLWEEAGRPEGQFEQFRTRAEVRLKQEAQSGNPQTEAPASTPETSADSGEDLS